VRIINGDCLEILKTLPDNSVDSIITDPPYELGFMGKKWDNTGIAYNVDLWKECLRVLKSGGHLLAFGGTRTYHRMAVAIEDAGFEVRDMIEWVYGSGFPKSLNIGKAVDKLQGNEREWVGKNPAWRKGNGDGATTSTGWAKPQRPDKDKGTSEWEGWGTALKPAHEPICMARKPLSEKTVAENVLKYGTGGINIDESRVGTTGARNNGNSQGTVGSNSIGVYGKAIKQDYNMGRFPANLIHDNSEEVKDCFPETSGKVGMTKHGSGSNSIYGKYERTEQSLNNDGICDSGNASRFFKSIIYTAKADKTERSEYSKVKNNHPTVKPVELMEYLINMVTPKGGAVLDPFMGSGTTGVASKNLSREFIGIELDPEYYKIAESRINNTISQVRLDDII
jgi:DNA modification methylase